MDEYTQPSKPTLNLKPIPIPQRQPRTLIANLAGALSFFKPNLVNEKDKEKGVDYQETPPGSGMFWDGTFTANEGAPTPSALINIAFGAMSEIKAFIESHETLKNVLIATQKAFAEIEDVLLGKGQDPNTLRPAETIKEAGRIKSRHDQMEDVINKAAASDPAQALKTCQAWTIPNGISIFPLKVTPKDIN